MPRFLLPACRLCAEPTQQWETGSIRPRLATIRLKLLRHRTTMKTWNVELSWNDLIRNKETEWDAISELL